MPKRKLPYKEGDWIAVPLLSGGWAAGVIARSPRLGRTLLGYFFRRRFAQLPDLGDVIEYTPSEAILIGMFGDLGLMQGRWKVIGSSEPWNRSSWPMTPFVHYDAINGRPFKREYADSGEGLFLKEAPCDEATSKSLPEDGLSGAEALEIRLDAALRKRPTPPASRTPS